MGGTASLVQAGTAEKLDTSPERLKPPDLQSSGTVPCRGDVLMSSDVDLKISAGDICLFFLFFSLLDDVDFARKTVRNYWYTLGTKVDLKPRNLRLGFWI